jgi:N-acetylneuraminate synthase
MIGGCAMKEFDVGGKMVGTATPCLIIAEIGGNFTTTEGGIRLVEAAAKAGCDAVKLQTFRADTITSRKAMFDMENTGRMSQWEHFRKYELSKEDHAAVFARAAELGLAWFSTPSHESDVDLLESLRVPAYKIGSDDAVNILLLKHVARTRKPILLSTGMCTMTEIQRSVDAILEENNDQILLFHCTTNYPTHPESVNLRAMVAMQRAFEFPIGYSDHTLGIDTCYAAAVLGARALEFHFTLDKRAEGPDHMLSKEPSDAANLVRKVRLLPTMLGDGIKRPMPSEMTTLHNNRKSLVLIRNVRAGEKLGPANIAIKRPGNGIACEHYWNIIGKTAARDLVADEPLRWDDLA